jgi:hypothetical protein
LSALVTAATTAISTAAIATSAAAIATTTWGIGWSLIVVMLATWML